MKKVFINILVFSFVASTMLFAQQAANTQAKPSLSVF